jgi:excisionase family DNA binding protein
MKRERTQALPSNLPPRGLSREQAAEYVGVSIPTFMQMVEAHTMPQPLRVGKRVIFDLHALDKAIDALAAAHVDDNNVSRNEWEGTECYDK